MTAKDVEASRVVPEHIRSVFVRYAATLQAGDAEGIAALFAPGAVLQDPIGTPPYVGREAIRSFFQAGFNDTGGGIRFEPEGEVRISGEHAACAFVAICEEATEPFEVSTIDFARFDAEGLIGSWTAIWGPENFRRLKR
ncbi:steroid delta-isomerase [Paraburkholderia sp. BL18I3N2]|uniref:nuclear transport factor 2 family protein n=1 Tax=Paraburkholderia sp. BL18I3N2 TaxID=1938799 RepID=UPI000D0533A4|nr:nuclear transport factor 2 family protein [Paraburkholderia sp. BL18I3N2]PRX27350.1 steroid delta-isomerase [Paraburkholderia sp. BL18I3N2]